MMEIHLKRAAIHDWKLIRQISIKTFSDTYKAYNKLDDMELYLKTNFTTNKIKQEISEPNNHFFIAYSNEEIVGYIKLIGHINEKEQAIEISRFYALKKYIGKGVGQAMMNFCIDYAMKIKSHFIFLIVWQQNSHAIHFYEKFGFKKTGTQEFILGKDVQSDWVMQKKVE